MKKLIKDLTQEEIKRICKKQQDKHGLCHSPNGVCPLLDVPVSDEIFCHNIPLEIRKFNEGINKEVDVPDESKEEK